MPDIGGGVISEFNFSSAWGVNPSAASGVALLDIAGGDGAFGLAVGDYVVFAFGSLASFPGVVTEVGESISFGQGRQQTFQVADNRVRLPGQMVFGAWNIEDDISGNNSARPTSPATGSNVSEHGSNHIDYAVLGVATPVAAGDLVTPATPWAQRRRYKHLLPEHWQSGIWTYTDAPFTTTQILNSAFNGAWGDFGFTRIYHAGLNASVLTGLDYSTGIKLSNLVSEINGKTGMEIRISGARTIIWGRKGEGLAPLPDATCTPLSTGSSLTSTDTGIRVVGERTRIQRLNVALEPDWKPGWNAFIDELAWLREVANTFSLPTATKSNLLDLAAFARKVTVYQYAKQKADLSLLDSRPFGKVSRSQLPAWVYIRELVYRSYRIPPAFTLHGVPLSSLDLADSLLCATDVVGEGVDAKQCYADSPIQFYPACQASAITRGQPLDLINARDIRLFYRNSTRDLRNEWTTAPDFEVDPIGKSIRFGVPTFIDGDPDEGESIYIRPNLGEGGYANHSSGTATESDYLDIVIPNPGFVITPAEVRASFCFLLGRFFQDYGHGPRRGSIASGGLDLHLLDLATDAGFTSAALGPFAADAVRLPAVTGTFAELVYEDGVGAVAKADAIAESALQLSAVQSTGGFTRNGLAGTELTPVVDRITVSITFGGGLTERVEYTKARASGAAFAERTLQRIQRSEELFSGQEALKREVREYKLLAAAERRPKTRSRARTHTTFTEVFEKPAGSEQCNTVTLRDKNSVRVWKAGDLVWLDAAGFPLITAGKGTFGGVVVATPPTGTKDINVANSGRVPVRVASIIEVGGVVFGTPGQRLGKNKGPVVLGRLAHGEKTPGSAGDEVFAMVDLGVAPSQVLPPFQPLLGTNADGTYYVTISDGRINERVPRGAVPTYALELDTALETAGERVRFPIAVGQEIVIVVTIDTNGEVTTRTLEVEAPGGAESHYIREVGETYAAPGVYRYRIASLQAAAGDQPAYLKPYLAGSHLSHFQDLISIINLGGSSVIKRYDATTNRYEFRGVIAHPDGKAQVDQDATTIRVRGNAKASYVSFTYGGVEIGRLNWDDGFIDDAGPLTIAIPVGGGATDLNGYVTLYKQFLGVYPSPDQVAKLYLRFENGSITEMLDGWDGAAVVTPHAPVDLAWGAELFYLNIPPVGGALLGANQPWTGF